MRKRKGGLRSGAGFYNAFSTRTRTSLSVHWRAVLAQRWTRSPRALRTPSREVRDQRSRRVHKGSTCGSPSFRKPTPNYMLANRSGSYDRMDGERSPPPSRPSPPTSRVVDVVPADLPTCVALNHAAAPFPTTRPLTRRRCVCFDVVCVPGDNVSTHSFILLTHTLPMPQTPISAFTSRGAFGFRLEVEFWASGLRFQVQGFTIKGSGSRGPGCRAQGVGWGFVFLFLFLSLYALSTVRLCRRSQVGEKEAR